jgi:hypothetical protein
MNHRKKLISKQQNEEQQHTSGQEQTSSLEFDTVETMLRHDALHTPVPPNIARRLQESVAQLPAPPPRSWWKRFFGENKE